MYEHKEYGSSECLDGVRNESVNKLPELGVWYSFQPQICSNVDE